MAHSEEAGSEDRIDRGTLMALFAMGLAVFAVANDFTALTVALPKIEHEFNADVSTVQWVINAYALVFGVLIVTGGRLADTFGRRRMFFLGSIIFAAFSVLGGIAQSAGWLIAARALMGIGGAMMWPATLGMTYAALPKRKAGLAGGLIIGVAGIGNAVGPLLGGALTVGASWRWILFLNLPIGAIACAVTWAEVHEAQEPETGSRIDYAGIATLSIGLTALLVALDQAPDWGFGDARVLVMLIAFVVLIGSFPLVERRMGSDALIPPDVARNPQFVAACIAVPLLAAGFFSCLLYLPQFMQKMLGYSPLGAGLGLLPMMAVFGAVSFVAGTLYERLGAKLSTSVGAFFMTVGLVIMSFLGASSGYGAVAVGMVVFGVGVGLFVSSATTSGVTVLDPSRASLAGGVLYMFQVAGGSIGLGLTTAIFTFSAQSTVHVAAIANQLSTQQEHAVNGILAGTASAHELLQRFPHAASTLNALSREAFAGGMQSSFRVAAALGAVGFLVAVGFIGGRIGVSTRRAAAEAPAAGSEVSAKTT